MKGLIILVCLTLTVNSKPPPPDYSTDLETSLRESLLTDYQIMQRPKKTVDIRTTLNLLSLNFLNIKEQKLAMTAYFEFVWRDRRLAWVSNSTYSNIKFIFSNEIFLWRPAIIIENSVEDVDVISKPQVPMRVRSDGTVTWTPGGVYTTHCEMDVKYYPLDIQTCYIQLSTWAYTSSEVLMVLSDDPINMEFYQQHGEWEVLHTSSETKTTKRETHSFSRLKFTIKFRRRPLFHMMNTLFPVILMGFLTVVIFKLSPESGERVGLSLTILLAYAVYLTLISENIPQTSMSASILSAYLASILLLQTVAVFLTVIYLDIYFKSDDEPVPAWLVSLAVCLECRKNAVSKVTPVTDTSSVLFEKRPQPSHAKGVISITSNQDDETNSSTCSMDGGNLGPEAQGRCANDDVRYADNENEMRYTWKEVSALLDKLTMYMYLFLVTTVTVVSMAIIVFSYATS